jgi:hypothetical protein
VHIFSKDYAVNIIVFSLVHANEMFRPHGDWHAYIQSSCDDCTAFASIEPLNSQMMWKWNTKKERALKWLRQLYIFIYVIWNYKAMKSHLSMSLEIHVSTVRLFFYKFKYSTLDFIECTNYLKEIAFISSLSINRAKTDMIALSSFFFASKSNQLYH